MNYKIEHNKFFSFALFGCFAYAGAPLLDTEDLESRDYIQLYSNDSNTDIDSCPNENAKKVLLEFIESKNFGFEKRSSRK